MGFSTTFNSGSGCLHKGVGRDGQGDAAVAFETCVSHTHASSQFNPCGAPQLSLGNEQSLVVASQLVLQELPLLKKFLTVLLEPFEAMAVEEFARYTNEPILLYLWQQLGVNTDEVHNLFNQVQGPGLPA